MTSTTPAPGSTTAPQEVDHLRGRVRLYLQVMLVLDLCARLSDVVSPLFIADLVMPEAAPLDSILRWVATIALAAGWAATSRSLPSTGLRLPSRTGSVHGSRL